MMSLRLWRILQHPSPNALRLLRKNMKAKPIKSNEPFLPALGYLLIAVFIFCLFTNMMVEFVILVCIVTGFTASTSLIALITLNTFNNLRCAAAVSGEIARLYRQSFGDLLAVSPTGPIGIHWSLYTNYIQEKHQLKLLRHEHHTIYKLIAMTNGLLILIPFLDPARGLTVDVMIFVALILVMAAVFLQLDTLQCTILGGLIGMVTPNYVKRYPEASIIAGVAFVSLQIAVYMVTLAICINLIAAFFVGIGDLASILFSLVGLVSLIMFYALREIIIWALFTLLLRRLNASLTDLSPTVAS